MQAGSFNDVACVSRGRCMLAAPLTQHAVWCQMHVGSFTREGTFEAAATRLGHVAGAGFTAVQLMPVTEHSDAWGYNPRQARLRPC